MAKVKICGITNLIDAKIAIDAGADALGFNFSKESPRYVSPIDAQIIIRQLPVKAWNVGVFVNELPAEVLKIARLASLDTLQFHGDEDENYLSQFSLDEFRIIKAIRVKDITQTESEIKRFTPLTDHLLLDGYHAVLRGGAGVSIDASLLKKLSLENAFLAGGLNSDNVFERVQAFQPFGVDVASGVEESPRRKNETLVRAFVSAANRTC